MFIFLSRGHYQPIYNLIYATIRLKNKRPPPIIVKTRDYKRMDVRSFRDEIESALFHIASTPLMIICGPGNTFLTTYVTSTPHGRMWKLEVFATWLAVFDLKWTEGTNYSKKQSPLNAQGSGLHTKRPETMLHQSYGKPGPHISLKCLAKSNRQVQTGILWREPLILRREKPSGLWKEPMAL